MCVVIGETKMKKNISDVAQTTADTLSILTGDFDSHRDENYGNPGRKLIVV